MVFESAVSQLLNTFLGDFVENLDGGQLNIGIWSGDVELRDLVLKPSALDQLDLPIQTVYGKIGKLVLKIPWKSLYTSPIVVSVADVFLLAQPNQQVEYDPLKEDHKLIAAKRKQIQKVEDAKKAEAEKNKPQADASFVQKLVQQVIKNIQLHVKSIHIRYEDNVTQAGRPFSLGVTLSDLTVESTDSNWKKAIVDDVSKIYKVVQLEGLAVYWNCGSNLYGDLPDIDKVHRMQNEISSRDNLPVGYTYILGPITASARLRMNQKPELDDVPYSIPVNHLNLDMGKLFIGISKAQYRDIIALADSMDRMAKGVPYRKFRPKVKTYKGNYAKWWKFAYQCVLESEVRRKKRNWDWMHMIQHRNMCREYGVLYKKKLQKSAKADDTTRIDECEKHLDLTSIVVIRQRIEFETERLEKTKKDIAKKSGWFGWMTGGGGSKEEITDLKSSTDLLKQFEKEMTAEEKARLYKAIDYQENASPAQYPQTFVDNSITFLLRTLEMELRDDENDIKTILISNLKGVKVKLETRSAASAMKAHVQIDDLTTLGLLQEDFTPQLIGSEKQEKGVGLLDVNFEINPLDKTCDQRLHVIARPLRIVYDAQTINKAIDIFKIPPDTSLDQISAAAGSGLTNVQEMTSTGLQYAISKHVRLDINIDFHAPYIIIPYGGKFTENENVLVINLGSLKIYSYGHRSSIDDVRRLFNEGITQVEIYSKMKEQSYDKFKLELSQLQVLVAQSDEDWKRYLKSSDTSDMHILNPLSLNIQYSKCLITDDPRLPLNRITGDLPSIDVAVSDARLMLLMGLVTSIPLPESEAPPPGAMSKNRMSGSTTSLILKLQENARGTKKLLKPPPPKESSTKDFVQFITLEAVFVMSELTLSINQQEHIGAMPSELATFKLKTMEASLVQRTFDTNISLLLGTLSLTQLRNNKTIHILSTPISTSDQQYLFRVNFTQVDSKSPELHSTYKSCESSLHLDFTNLGVILHQEGLLSLISFATQIQDNISGITSQTTLKKASSGASLHRTLSTISESLSERGLKVKKKKKKLVVVETIKFKIEASLQEFTVSFATDSCQISSCAIRGISSDIIVKSTYTQVNAKLMEIAVIDLNPETCHSLILSGTEGIALTTQIVINNLEGESEKPDVDVTVKMGGMRIVFVNWFISNMLNFLNQFQEAQQAIIEASEAAAQKAKENVKNAYSKAMKLSLNIHLKAPDIVVPVNSKSYHALLLDLGVISLTNRFLTLDIKNEEGFSAVVDELKLKLADLKVARIKLGGGKGEILNECVLLEPLNFTLIIKRNLSAGWYRAIPDLDLSGKIQTINLMLSQEDYGMIMSTLSGNLAEGQVDKNDSQATLLAEQNMTYAMIEPTLGANKNMAVLSKEDLEPEVHVFLKFTFSMEQLSINLYSGGIKELSDSSECRDPNTHLAHFSLDGLSVKGRLLSDNSIVTSVLLVNCVLDDMRKGREDKLNRLIERSITDNPNVSMSSLSIGSTGTQSEAGVPQRCMIDVTFQQKGNSMFADVRVYSFTVILSVDYLMRVADFFAVEQKTAKKSQATKSSVSVARSVKSKSIDSEVPEQPPSQITLNLKIEKPDIILVEHMDNIDTNAMILNSEVLVKFRMHGAHQVVNGVIKDLQLYTCNYNPKHRLDTKSNVLHPVTISLAGSTPSNKGLHLELVVEDVHLRVSPATIELLNKVLETMSKSTKKEEEGTQEPFVYDKIWVPETFEDNDYWFLKTEIANEAEEEMIVRQYKDLSRPVLEELCFMSVPSIVITVELGVGNKTLPMLMLETSFKGNARNWSSQLSVNSSLTVQMGYYNSRLALWEPLIEPVDMDKGNTFLPWEIKLELSMNDQEDVTVLSPLSEAEDPINQPPVMSIDIISEKSLELTVTKTCLEVLQNLAKGFASAIKPDDIKKTDDNIAPYKVLNEIGEDVTLLLEDTSFKIAEGGSLEDINKSSAVPLQLKPDLASTKALHLSKELNRSSQTIDHRLHVKIDSSHCELYLPVVRADKRFFLLNYRGQTNDNWGVISEVKVDEGVTIITLRSILQVYNHFNVAVDVYYMTRRGNELELIGSVEPNSFLNVPLKAVYTSTNELFFAIAGYSITTSPYIWKDLQANVTVTKILQCRIKDPEKGRQPFIIKAIGETEQVYYENTLRHTMASTCYNIHLRPAVTLKNYLPLDVICCVEELIDEFQVKPGDTLQLPNVDPGKSAVVIRIPEYLEKEWSCRQEIPADFAEFSVWTFHSYDSPTKMSLDLGIHTLNKNGSLILSLYCPFWMLNKTGLMIGYRTGDENLNVLHHPANFKGPIMFSFNARNFFGKKKASIRVDSGDWSDKFSLDVAGSSGVINCKANNKVYQIGVHNQLTYNSLTKQVTFTPYYVVINNAPFVIECQESDRPADAWTKVEPKSCSALWPKSELEDKLLKLRISGTEEMSAPFLYTESHTTLLRLNNKYGGLNVDIQLTEGAVYINVASYEVGSAPALIMNHTSKDMNFWEKESVQIRTLKPKHCMLYTWENPSGPRLLVWEKSHKNEIENDLRKDDYGNYHTDDKSEISWASFLDGMQRVLLFTECRAIAEGASSLFEVIQQEITVSIHGMGLSLVNNLTRQEIMYIGVASSGVIWETCKINRNRYKPLGTKESTHMENAYQQWLAKSPSSDNLARTIIDNKTEVDFGLLLMRKPHKRHIRRTFQTGVWLQLKTSPSQTQIHAKVNRLQIDNQMFDCIFPVVLAPIPPPKSVAADSGIRPFVEISIVQLLIKNSQIRQFKYFKVLVQEFHIKVDLGFVNALVELMEESESTDEDERQLFLTDMKLVDEALYSHASNQSIQEQKSFYDLLHFSPLKIHVSFSMAAGTSSAGQNATTPNFINVLLQGVGVTLTDLQDVVFKLAFFERDYTFLTQRQLVGEATSHYIGQLIKQLYVLVLGLDVIGNPYGLVIGISKGVEDLFYEPFQGAIQGPSEFAEGLALGVKSLFGHTVGGAVGAVHRITGAMGKGIAALTFDEEFQRKRRDQINKKPSTMGEGFARSGKGLVMGVFDGVTGVFTKPVSGAKEEGVEGFFKGLGKGAVGLVTRPAAGVIDFASGSLDVVKRATEVGEDTLRLRPPRFLQGDGLVRPYNKVEAEGHKLLAELSKGKYAKTDIYVHHYVVVENKEILLLTDKRLAYIVHNDIFGGWQMEWSYTWQELPHPAKIVPKGISITTSEAKKKKLFGSNDTTKTILIPDISVKEELCCKIEALRST